LTVILKQPIFTQWLDGNYAILAPPQFLLGTALDCRQIFVPI
jgi:hypothetical protein